MELKNQTFIEKYIEKIAIAIAGIFAIFVLWIYVIGSPYSVEITGLNGKIKPAEVEKQILSKTTELERAINAKTSPLPRMHVPPYTEEFRVRAGKKLLPVDYFTAILGKPGIDPKLLTTAGVTTPKLEYYVPTAPPPIRIKYTTGFGVLREPSINLVARYEQLIGTQVPRDIAWVSVSADFDLKKWRLRLSQASPQANQRPIPEHIWRSKLQVVNVILYRQLFNPDTNKWGPEQKLSQLPNNQQMSFIQGKNINYRSPQITWAKPEADAALRIAELEHQRLTRPPFPALTEGLWLPPGADPRNLSPADAERFGRLQEKINQLQKELINMKSQASQTQTDPKQSPKKNALNKIGNIAAAADFKLKILISKLDRKKREMNVLIGIEDAYNASTEFTITNNQNENRQDSDEGSFEKETIRIWQHDMSVKAGQSVRYRMEAVVLNPLFFEPSVPTSQRKKYFNKLAMASLKSDWTTAIQVLEEHHFFLTKVNKQMKAATVEVYCVFNGKWQVQEFMIKAGDPIGHAIKMSGGGVERMVNMNVGAVLVDIDFDTPSKQGIGGTTSRIIYYDSKTNRLDERVLELDRNSKKRRDLQTKSKAQ